MSKTVLEEAQAIVYGDREKTYDDPNANFRRIALIWQSILGVPVTEAQVAICMAGLKLARLAHSPQHRDSIVDTAGYMACLERINDPTVRPESSPLPAGSPCFNRDRIWRGLCDKCGGLTAIWLPSHLESESLDNHNLYCGICRSGILRKTSFQLPAPTGDSVNAQAQTGPAADRGEPAAS